MFHKCATMTCELVRGQRVSTVRQVTSVWKFNPHQHSVPHCPVKPWNGDLVVTERHASPHTFNRSPPRTLFICHCSRLLQALRLSFTGVSYSSKEQRIPCRRGRHTTEVTDWNSQREQFPFFTCCLWLPGSRARCGGRVWLADVSLCRDAAEVFSRVLGGGRALIVW